MNLARYRSPVSAYFVSVVCLLLFACSVLSACAQSQRQDVLRDTLTGLNAGRDGFLTWDQKHQQAILESAPDRATYDKQIAAYRSGPQSEVLQGMTLAYRGVAVAATQSDQTSLDAALKQAAELIAQIKQLLGSK